MYIIIFIQKRFSIPEWEHGEIGGRLCGQGGREEREGGKCYKLNLKCIFKTRKDK